MNNVSRKKLRPKRRMCTFIGAAASNIAAEAGVAATHTTRQEHTASLWRVQGGGSQARALGAATPRGQWVGSLTTPPTAGEARPWQKACRRYNPSRLDRKSTRRPVKATTMSHEGTVYECNGNTSLVPQANTYVPAPMLTRWNLCLKQTGVHVRRCDKRKLRNNERREQMKNSRRVEYRLLRKPPVVEKLRFEQ